MKHLKLSLTDKNYYLLQRIAQADDRRLNDLIYLIFSTGLSYYFCERSICISKNDDEYTEEEIKQKALNDKLLLDNRKFHFQSDKEQKDQGYKYVDTTYDNYDRDNNFIEQLSDEFKNNALNEIKQDYKEIEENIIKENTLKQDTEYCLVNGTNEKSIVNGNTWNDSEVKNND